MKLAYDLQRKKYVAIKVLKSKEHQASKEALELFYTEISILFQCKHRNVVKLIDASFDGTLVKEMICDEDRAHSKKAQSSPQAIQNSKKLDPKKHGYDYTSDGSDNSDRIVLKRKGQKVYYVMKWAQYGDLYSMIELSERFSETLARSIYI